MKSTRILITLPSQAQAHLIEQWATVTGRGVPNLVVYLVESGLVKAMKDGIVPQQALDSMNAFMDSQC